MLRAVTCLALVLAAGRAVATGGQATLEANTTATIASVDPGYLSFNLDWWDPVQMAEYKRPDYPDGCPRFASIANRGSPRPARPSPHRRRPLSCGTEMRLVA